MDFLQHGRFVPVHLGGGDVDDGSFSDGADGDRMRRMRRPDDAERRRHQLFVQTQHSDVQRNFHRRFGRQNALYSVKGDEVVGKRGIGESKMGLRLA